MAGKEHNIKIVLDAQTGGSFSRTFQKAQQEMAAVSKEIQQMSRAQRDISGYQKQQAAVEKTTVKLESLKNQERLLQQELTAAKTVQASTSEAAQTAAASMGAESDKAKELALEAQRAAQNAAHLEREHQKLSDRIKDTNGALERQKQRLDQTGEALRSAGVSTDNLERESRELTQQLQVLQARQEEAANGAQTFGDQTANAIETIGQTIAAIGIVNSVGKIKDGFLQAVDVSKEFSASMSNVEALSGANATEIAALNAQAKELGATTQFTAKQSADAMGYMAMAGWDAQEMMSGMDGVLSAAAASGEDLALVSDIVTDSMSAFGLAAKDTAHFSDVLAATAANANTSIGIMGETFKGSASVAGALGYSIEDVSVAVGLMANVGVKGSMANTALRNTFNGLLGGVTLTSAAFGEYEYSAVKADGSMKDLGETINELRGYFEQMSESERVLNAQEIAGERGYNGLLGILMATEESYQSLYEKINNCEGAASRMAKIKMDNLHGDVLLAESAWEGFQIAVGEKATPAMRGFYQVQADVLSGMSELVDAHPALTQGIMTTTGLLAGATTAVTGLSAAVKIFKALDMASLFMGPAGLALKIGAGVAVAAGGVVALTSAYREQVPSVRELTEAAREMQETLDAGAAAYEDTMAETLAAANAADVYISKLEQMGDVKSLDASGAQEYKNVLSLLAETVPELADGINLQTGEIDGGTAALRANTAAWQENAKAKAYQDYYTEMYKQEANLTVELEKNKVGLTKATLAQEAAEKKRADTLRQMEAANAKGVETGDYSAYRELEASLDAINGEITLAEQSAANYTKAIADCEAAVESYRGEAEDVRQAIENLNTATEEQTGLSEEAAAQANELKAVMDSAGASLLDLASRYEEAYSAAYDSIPGQYSLWDEAAKVEAASAASMNNALESQISYWRQYDSNIDALTARTSDIEGLSEMIASFADGSSESVNAIAGMAKANDGDLKKMVENWQKLQKEQKTASDSLAQLTTDFQGEMAEILESTQETIDGMNLSAEAARAAESTVLAFAKGARDQLPAVQSAFDSIANAVQNSLSNARTAVPASAFQSVQKAIGNGLSAVSGFASGTMDAPPGWAWVGEEGPELMRLRGGETILPAEVSAQVADASRNLPETFRTELAFLQRGENHPERMSPLHREIQPSYIETTLPHSEMRPPYAETSLPYSEMIVPAAADIADIKVDGTPWNMLESPREEASPVWAKRANRTAEYLHNNALIPQTIETAPLSDLPQYASGTLHAEAGTALVGENAPELMYTEPKPEPLYALDGSSGQGNGGTTINLTLYNSPTYNIGDGSNRDALMSLFDNLTAEQAEKLAEFILDTLADHERNKALEAF